MKFNALALLPIFFILSCGDEDGGTNLDNFVACGGNVEGTWNYTRAESSDGTIPESPGCDMELALRTSNASVSGTIVFDTDNTYDQTVTAGLTITIDFPASCISEDSTQCSDVNESNLECTGDVTVSCECVNVDSTTVEETGTWSVEGSVLTLLPNDLDDATDDEDTEYCVTGNELAVKSRDDFLQSENLLILTKQ